MRQEYIIIVFASASMINATGPYYETKGSFEFPLYSTGQIMSKLFCNLLLYYLKEYLVSLTETHIVIIQKEKTYNEEENTSPQV